MMMVEWTIVAGGRAHRRTIGTKKDRSCDHGTTLHVATPDLFYFDYPIGGITAYNAVVVGVTHKNRCNGAVANRAKKKKRDYYDENTQKCENEGKAGSRLDVGEIKELSQINTKLESSRSAAPRQSPPYQQLPISTLRRGTADILFGVTVTQGKKAWQSVARVAKDQQQLVDTLLRDKHTDETGAQPSQRQRTRVGWARNQIKIVG
jgi:hypothetical protein